MRTILRYHIEEDTPFLPKDIFAEDLYCPGFVSVKTEETISVKRVSGTGGAFVLQGEFGKCYEVTFTPESGVITAMFVKGDPRALEENETWQVAK